MTYNLRILKQHPFPLTQILWERHRIYRVATAAFWGTFHHDGKISPGWWGWGCTPTTFHYSSYHQVQSCSHYRLNIELDLQSLFVLLCTAVLIGCVPATPHYPRIWVHIRGRYWSAKIDDISLWPPGCSVRSSWADRYTPHYFIFKGVPYRIKTHERIQKTRNKL